jgi:hypothetical protein
LSLAGENMQETAKDGKGNRSRIFERLTCCDFLPVHKMIPSLKLFTSTEKGKDYSIHKNINNNNNQAANKLC